MISEYKVGDIIQLNKEDIVQINDAVGKEYNVKVCKRYNLLTEENNMMIKNLIGIKKLYPELSNEITPLIKYIRHKNTIKVPQSDYIITDIQIKENNRGIDTLSKNSTYLTAKRIVNGEITDFTITCRYDGTGKIVNKFKR